MVVKLLKVYLAQSFSAFEPDISLLFFIFVFINQTNLSLWQSIVIMEQALKLNILN